MKTGIRAPKEMVLIEGTGHFAVWTVPDRFLSEMHSRLHPFVARP